MTIERRVRILQETDSMNPRTDWDCNTGRMLCFHSRYDLGDKHDYDSDNLKRELACEAVDDLEEELLRLEEVADALYNRACNEGIEDHQDCMKYSYRLVGPRMEKLIDEAFDNNYVALTLSLYDHSGISMSTGGAICGWDSSNVGIIVATKKDIEETFNGNEGNAIAAMEHEVVVYDAYLRGSVWGFITEYRECASCNACVEHDECDENAPWIDDESCFGFYGDDHEASGLKSEVGPDYADLVDSAEIEYA